MTVPALLARLADLGITLSVEGTSIRCRGRRGALTPDFAEGVRQRRAALLAALSGGDNAAEADGSVCPSCRRPADLFQGRTCLACAMREQAEEDARRWEGVEFPEPPEVKYYPAGHPYAGFGYVDGPRPKNPATELCMTEARAWREARLRRDRDPRPADALALAFGERER